MVLLPYLLSPRMGQPMLAMWARDLVGAAGDETEPEQSQTAGDGDGLVAGLHVLSTRLLVLDDLHDAAVGILEQVAAEGGVRGVGRPKVTQR